MILIKRSDLPVRSDDDGRQGRPDPERPSGAKVLPGGAEDVVLHVGVGGGEQVDEAPHQALLLRKLLGVLPLASLGTVILIT